MNTYNVSLLTDNSKPDNASHRLSVIRFKTKKGEENKSPNKCVSIPRIILDITPSILNNALTTAFHEMQDEVIRSAIVDDKATTITEEMISYETVASYMEEKATSQRLSGENVKAWFEACMKEPLTLALANALKLGDNATPDELAKLEAAVTQHETLIISLASPRSNYNKVLAGQLQRAIATADNDGVIKPKLEAKLASFMEDKSVTLALNL